MKFPQDFLAGAGVLTAGAGGEMTGVCTALNAPSLILNWFNARWFNSWIRKLCHLMG